MPPQTNPGQTHLDLCRREVFPETSFASRRKTSGDAMVRLSFPTLKSEPCRTDIRFRNCNWPWPLEPHGMLGVR